MSDAEPNDKPNAEPKTTFQEALEGVSLWRREAEALFAQRFQEIDRQEHALREDMARLQREVDALDALRAQLHAEIQSLDGAEQQRAHEAMLAGLAGARDALAGRAVAFQEAREAELARAQAAMEDPETADLVAEYERFSELEGTLDALPEGYRHAIQAHHEAVQRRLAPFFQLAEASQVALDAPELPLSLIASLEFDEDRPESLTFLLPIDAGVSVRWSERAEDLPARLGYRVMALAVRLAKALGTPEAPVTWRNHEGFLAIQLWLGDHTVEGDVNAAAEEAVREELHTRANQLLAARILARLEWVAPEVFDPPDEEPAGVKVRIATRVGDT